MQKGFALIELLVVVLIIGILSAIALPQYRIAVEKAKATEAILNLKTIALAEQRYYLANGSFTTALDELDITVPAEGTYDYHVSTGDYGASVYAIPNEKGGSVTFELSFASDKLLNLYCRGAEDICKHFGLKISENDGGYWKITY